MFFMMPLRRILLPVAALAAAGVGRADVEYRRDVKPLLQERCYACHGALKQKGGLRLDTADFIRQGGETGSAITPGDPAGSLLVGRVATPDLEERMPPEHEGEPFKPAEVQVLSDWIAAGATAPADEKPEEDPNDHWAFRPLVRPPVPPVDGPWGRHPIDAFIATQHREYGLAPQPEAPREVLLRRLYLDLIGLPPSAEEIAGVGGASEDGWYEEVVERLLADPRHGERWARHWMDVWRYSDWWGLGDQLRNSQKHMWHWRDWIVESLNEDASYAEMVRLMLAADELHPGDLDKLRATGFLARNFFLFNRQPWMEETVEHVGKGLLGLSINCAKCHDHKYDPISQQDYYKMRAFFEPYHVRLDMVPGEVDLNRDGIPRVYDGWPEEPTWRFVRGEESQPDQSAAIAPGVPGIFTFRELEVQTVSLPPVAWQPERQPWVIDAHVAAARRRVEAAASARATAAGEVARAEQLDAELAASPPPSASPSAVPSVIETFATLDPRRWKRFGGEWAHTPGRLEQKRDGAVRSVLRLLEPAPRDIEVTIGPLSPELPLREPSAGGGVPTTPESARAAVAVAQSRLTVAERALALAHARLGSTEARGVALRAAWAGAVDAAEKKVEAVRAERAEAAATARHGLADKELQQLVAAPDKKDTLGKEIAAAREACAKAEAAAAEPVAPDAAFASLPGAKWTPTRFRDSTADDPDVPFPAQSTGRRKALADWITDPRHPLTARVAVNHVWTRHLGSPLVATVFDFGRKGAAPTHPELLDWLADEFIENGWSMKHLHRLIVTSAAYRMSSSLAGAGDSVAKDPDNRHLWRRTPVRLEAELVRDTILVLSGELDPTVGGPPVPPGSQEDSKRRSLYFFHSNNDRNLFLTTFDGAAVKECYRREQSIVPQQALALSNSRLVQDASRKIAERLSQAASGEAAVVDDPGFVRSAWLEVLAINAGEPEVAACLKAMAQWSRIEPDDPGAARAHLIWTLLNHNDFVTQR